MWAFVFYNYQKNKIVVSRDRYGKKPLYYYYDENNLIFSSEIKSIFSLLSKKRIINEHYFKSFICFGHWPNHNTNTFYKEIKQIMPGNIVEIDLDKDCFQFKFCNKNTISNYLTNSSTLNLQELIYDSVKIRLRSDVQNSIFISGGVDSSIVASYAQENKKDIRWITGNTNYGNDLKYVRELAKNLDIEIEEIVLSYSEDVVERIKNMTNIYEIPISLLGNSVAMNFLYEKVFQKGIKVVLDGTGGDEVFGGYFDFYSKYLINKYVEDNKYIEFLSFCFYNLINKNLNFIELLKNFVLKFIYYHFNINFHKDTFKLNGLEYDLKLSQNNARFYNNISDFQLYDVEFGRLQTWLRMNDSNSMMYSVENRSPMLDYRLAYNIKNDEKLKFNRGFNKFILRKNLPNSISDKIKWRRDKQGFRWSYDYFLERNFVLIKQLVYNSFILEKLIGKKYIDSLFENDFSNFKKVMILRCYSIAVLEEVYTCTY